MGIELDVKNKQISSNQAKTNISRKEEVITGSAFQLSRTKMVEKVYVTYNEVCFHAECDSSQDPNRDANVGPQAV